MIGQLLIRFAGDTSLLDKSIKQAQRSLQKGAMELQAVGSQMSMGLTLPLAAFGAAAIKAAGDAEAMRNGLVTTMKDAGYSTAQATQELEALREAAKAPGLDLEQAVKGSMRLQSIGMIADKARGVIVQLANAIAMSGGSAEQLDGVTRQFSQMLAKGRVLQEDLSIIQENMPAVSKAMQDAFGTRSAEDLRKMGITAEQFVSGVTQQLSKLPRVQGGITNAIVNAGVAIKQFAASIGESLNKTFGITSAMDSFSSTLEGLAKKFGEMDGGTRKAVAAIGVFLIALGPAYQVTGLLISAFGRLSVAVTVFTSTMRTATAGGTKFLVWWRALDAAMKTTVIGAVVAVVVSLGLAMAVLAKETTAAEKAQMAVNDAQKTGLEQARQQVSEAEQLVRQLGRENITREEKNAILKRLREINPKYFGDLKEEKDLTTKASDALARYSAELIRAATVKAATDKIGELRAAMADMSDEADPSMWQKVWDGIRSGGNAWAYNALQAKTAAGNVSEAKKEYEAQIAALQKVVDENITVNDIVKDNTDKTKENTDAKGKSEDASKKRMEALIAEADALSEMNEQEAKAALAQQKMADAAMLKPLEALPQREQGGGDRAGEVTKIGAAMMASSIQANTFADAITRVADGFNYFNEAATNTFTQMPQIQTVLQGVGNTMGLMGQMSAAAAVGFADAAASGETSFKAMGRAALQAAGQVVKAFMMQAVASVAADAFKKFGLLGFIGAVTGGAAVVGLFNGLMSKVAPPALAKGGLATGPTLAMVGDNKNASVDPEVIMPVSKLKGMIAGVGGGPASLSTRISGNDLLVVLEYAQRRKQRTRGF